MRFFLSSLVFVFAAQTLLAQSGSVDPAFNPGTGVDLAVYWIAPQANGQILIGGNFTSFDDVERINIARLNANGSRDDSFDPGTALDGPFPYVNSIAVQPGTKILVAGSFTNSAATNLTRLNDNGSLDATFTSVINDAVNALVLQTNGAIVIGGFFSQVDGRARASLARLDSNGAVDLTYTPSVTGGSAAVYALALQPDNRLLVAGSFTAVSGNSRTNLARLNSDGTIDGTFKPTLVSGGQLGTPYIYSVAIDSIGRIVIGGDFSSVNGLPRANIARLNSDGSIDSTFNSAAGTDSPVNSITLEKFDKILLGGYFTSVNGAPNNYVARLHTDGTLDSSFDAGFGPDDTVFSVALQSDGKILLGGAFVDVGVSFLAGVARLQNIVNVSPFRTINSSLSNNVFRTSVPTYSGRSYTLQYKNSLTNSTWTGLTAVPGDGTVKVLSDASANAPTRFYRVEVH